MRVHAGALLLLGFAVLLGTQAILGVKGATDNELSVEKIERKVEPPEVVTAYVPVEVERPRYIFPIHPDDFVLDGKGGALTSAYGERDPSVIGGLGDEYHDGLDLWGVSHVGTWHARIVAVSDGVILNHWLDHPVYGKMIEVLHDDGNISMYAHLSESFIHEKRLVDGQWVPWRVKQGDVIGRQGNTGKSKGRLAYREHLHFQLTVDGETVNPLQYIDVPGLER